MQLPFLWIFLGWIVGILLAPWLAFPLQVIEILFCATLAGLWFVRGTKGFVPLLILSLCFLAVLGQHARKMTWKETETTRKDMDEVSLEGTVVSHLRIKQVGKKERFSFILDAERMLGAQGDVRPFREKVQVFLHQPGQRPAYGDRIRVWGRMRRPAPPENPGAFPYRKYLESRGIRMILTGYGYSALTMIERNQKGSFFKGLFCVRHFIAKRIEAYYDRTCAPFFKALILGERGDIAPESRAQFMKTGTAHLLAVSGLHVTLVAGACYAFLLLLGLPRRVSLCLGIVSIILYVSVAGFGIPLRRAGFMAGAGFLALCIDRPKNPLNLLCLIGFALLVHNPLLLGTAQFQLSFLSVTALIMGMPRLRDFGFLRWGLAQTLLVTLATFPLVLWHFHIVSWTGVVANVLAIPLFHLALLFSLLSLPLGSLPVVGFCLNGLAGLSLRAGLAWIRGLSRFEWGYCYLARPSPVLLWVYYTLLTAYFIAARSHRDNAAQWRRGLGSACLLSALLFFLPPQDNRFSVTIFSAGSNELAYIAAGRGRHWLVNAGRSFPSDQGYWILTPYLKAKGIRHLQGVVFTDQRRRHTGGLRSILRQFSVGSLYASGKDGRLGFLSGEEVRTLRCNRSLPLGPSAELKVLGEGRGGVSFMLEYSGRHFLIFPNLNRALVSDLKQQMRSGLEVDVLILPVFNSWDPEYMEALFDVIDPDVVTVPNAHLALKAFLAERDIPLFDSQHAGAIRLRVDDNQIRVRSYRLGPVL